MTGFIAAFYYSPLNHNKSKQFTVNDRLRLAPVPHWTTSVCSSTVTDLVLIYESATYESLRTNDERRITPERTFE
jgi:hypothetical protein